MDACAARPPAARTVAAHRRVDPFAWALLALAVLTLALSALTFTIYPVVYDGLLRAEPIPILLLTVRNVLLLVLFVHSILAVVRIPASAQRASVN